MKSPVSVKWWEIGLCIVLLHQILLQYSSVYGNPTSWEASGTQPKKPREICRLASEGSDDNGIHLCRVGATVSWVTNVVEPIYSIPLITARTEIGGSRRVALVTITGSVVMVEADGQITDGWPIVFPNSTFHSSPVAISLLSSMVFDSHGDSESATHKTNEFLEISSLCLASIDGQISAVEAKPYGTRIMNAGFNVPTLYVLKEWHEGHAEFEGGGAYFDILSSMYPPFKPYTHLRPERGHPLPSDDDKYPSVDAESGSEAREAPTHAYRLDQDNGSEFIPNSIVLDTLFPDEANKLMKVPPHILASPVMVDVDGDGFDDAVIAVSYFYDRRQYSREDAENFDGSPENYVASAIMAFSYRQMEWIWETLLELTTDTTDSKGYLYGSPTVVDLDGDGILDIVVGSATGHIYALNASDGILRWKAPIKLNEIREQVAVADVVAEVRGLEILAADVRGNLVCLSSDGKVLWKQFLSGAALGPPSVGDIDGDGHVDVVVVVGEFPIPTQQEASHGDVWVLRGSDGRCVSEIFPMRFDQQLSSGALLVKIDTGGKEGKSYEENQGSAMAITSLHLVVPSRDGLVFIIEGSTGYVTEWKAPGQIHAQVLCGDLTGKGSLDLIVVTMGGDVISLAIDGPADESNSWRGVPRGVGGRSGFAHGGLEAIVVNVLPSEIHATLHDGHVILPFSILDGRKQSSTLRSHSYKVVVTLGHPNFSKREELDQLLLFEKIFTQPGKYTADFKLQDHCVGVLFLTMTDELGQVFQDTVPIHHMVNVYLYEHLKYLILIPCLVFGALLVLYSGRDRDSLLQWHF